MSNKTSPWVWVGLGCAVVLAGMVAFVAFILLVVFGSMRAADPYKVALQRAQNDPRVIAALGTPIEPGWLVSGSINAENQSGSADVNIPISGPKQSASIHVVGTKEGGRWTYSRMIVTPKDGPVIDLLDTGASSVAVESAPSPVLLIAIKLLDIPSAHAARGAGWPSLGHAVRAKLPALEQWMTSSSH